MNPKSKENWLSSWIDELFQWLLAIFIALLVGCMVIALTSCAGTSHPHAVQSSVASFDGNEQNSGFLGFDKDGFGRLTHHARDRYNALIAVYGSKFSPPLTFDAGISPYFFDPPASDGYRIDRGHLAQFMTMQRWKKQGVK